MEDNIAADEAPPPGGLEACSGSSAKASTPPRTISSVSSTVSDTTHGSLAGRSPDRTEQGLNHLTHPSLSTNTTYDSLHGLSITKGRLSELPLLTLLQIVESTTDISSLCTHPFLIYLCGGRDRPGSVRSFLWPEVDVLNVDSVNNIGDSLEDTECLVSTRVVACLLRLTTHPQCVGVLASPPCRTFSAATHSGSTGPMPYRDLFRRFGIGRGAQSQLPTKVVVDNLVAINCIRIMSSSLLHGGMALLEHPVARRAGSTDAITGREAHCSLFDFPPMIEFMVAHNIQLVKFDQCMLQQVAQKRTAWACSPGILGPIQAAFGHLQCNHHHLTDGLLGFKDDGSFKTTHTEVYTGETCQLVAECVREYLHRRSWCVVPKGGVIDNVALVSNCFYSALPELTRRRAEAAAAATVATSTTQSQLSADTVLSALIFRCRGERLELLLKSDTDWTLPSTVSSGAEEGAAFALQRHLVHTQGHIFPRLHPTSRGLPSRTSAGFHDFSIVLPAGFSGLRGHWYPVALLLTPLLDAAPALRERVRRAVRSIAVQPVRTCWPLPVESECELTGARAFAAQLIQGAWRSRRRGRRGSDRARERVRRSLRCWVQSRRLRLVEGVLLQRLMAEPSPGVGGHSASVAAPCQAGNLAEAAGRDLELALAVSAAEADLALGASSAVATAGGAAPQHSKDAPLSLPPRHVPPNCAAKVWFATNDDRGQTLLLSHFRRDSREGHLQPDTLGGKMDPIDDGSFWRCAVRELGEEADIPGTWQILIDSVLADAPSGQAFVELRKPSDGSVHLLAIWLVWIPADDAFAGTRSVLPRATLTPAGEAEAIEGSFQWRPVQHTMDILAGFAFIKKLHEALSALLETRSAAVPSEEPPPVFARWGEEDDDGGQSSSESDPDLARCPVADVSDSVAGPNTEGSDSWDAPWSEAGGDCITELRTVVKSTKQWQSTCTSARIRCWSPSLDVALEERDWGTVRRQEWWTNGMATTPRPARLKLVLAKPTPAAPVAAETAKPTPAPPSVVAVASETAKPTPAPPEVVLRTETVAGLDVGGVSGVSAVRADLQAKLESLRTRALGAVSAEEAARQLKFTGQALLTRRRWARLIIAAAVLRRRLMRAHMCDDVAREAAACLTEIARLERERKRQSVASEVSRLKQLQQFDEAYSAQIKASIPSAAGTRARTAASDIDMLHSAGVCILASPEIQSAKGIRSVPFDILPDNCSSTGFVAPEVFEWLQRHVPECVEVESDAVRAAEVTVVNESSQVVIEKVISISGLTLAGANIGRLTGIRVVRGFRAGLLLGTSFFDSLKACLSYEDRTFSFVPPGGGARLHTPFITGAAGLNTASLLADAVKPVAYLPETVRIGKRCEQWIRVRVPHSAPVGSTVLLSPMEDSRADIGVLVSHGLQTVGADGYVKVKVINPHEKRVVLPLMTAVARFTLDPALVETTTEFNVDQIMKAVNLGPELTPEMVDELRAMFESRKASFASTPQYAHGVKCKIPTPAADTGTAPIPSVKQPRWSPAQTEALKGVIDAQVKAGYLARTSSDFSSRPLLVAKQPSGEWRLVVDFRDLNKITVGDRYPLPNIQDNLDRVGRAKWFTAIDLLAGFHQLEIDELDAHKTAFQTPWGQYMYIRMPMGLKHAPSTFCRVVGAMLQGLPADIALDYVDDVLIATDGSFSDHVRDVGLVFDRLLESGFTVKAKKCFVGFREVPYLGYLVGADGTRLDPAKIAGITSMPFEAAVANPASFVGMVQHWSRHIPNFAVIAAPFYDLKRAKASDRRAILQKDEQRIRACFVLIQDAIANGAVLARPRFDRPFILATDASATGCGAVLAQLDDSGVERPVAFWSHIFTFDERGGSVTDREGRAVRDAVRHFRCYLLGQEFAVYTDHAALTYLMVHQHPENTLRQRWQGQLQEFTGMDIRHRPGKNMVVPDAISRLCALVFIGDGDPEARPETVPPTIDLVEEPSPEWSCDGVSPEDRALRAAVTLSDVDDFVKPRSFMLQACTPSIAARREVEAAREAAVCAAAALLGLERPVYGADSADASDVFGAALPSVAVAKLRSAVANSEMVEKFVTVPDGSSGGDGGGSVADAVAAVVTALPPSGGGKVFTNRSCLRVAVALVSGSRLLVCQQDDGSGLGFPGGEVTLKARSYRDHALLHFASYFGRHTPESLLAIQGAAYTCKIGKTTYFFGRLPEGCSIESDDCDHPWIHSSVGLIRPRTSKRVVEWLELDSEGALDGLTARARSEDVECLRRIVAARCGAARHSMSLAAAISVGPAPSLEGRPAPSSASIALSVPGDVAGTLAPMGPALHDCLATARAAIGALRTAVEADPLHVLCVDLEGTLRVGGVIEFFQASAGHKQAGQCTHVFDIQLDDTPLTGIGYDAQESLRSLLEDPSVLKIFHCGRGDTAVLAHEYGIVIRNVWDTSVADSAIRTRPLKSPRNLQAVVEGYTGFSLQFKNSVTHTPEFWKARPMDELRFKYAYEDVLYLRAVFVAQLGLLRGTYRYPLVVDASQQMCPPLCHPIAHGLFAMPSRLVVVLHDGLNAVMFHEGDGPKTFPSFPFTPDLREQLLRRGPAVVRDLWATYAGTPIKGVAGQINNRIRKPARVGDSYLYEVRCAPLGDELLQLLLRSLSLHLVAVQAESRRRSRRLLSSVPLMECSQEAGWVRACAYSCLYADCLRSPAVLERGGEAGEGGGEFSSDGELSSEKPSPEAAKPSPASLSLTAAEKPSPEAAKPSPASLSPTATEKPSPEAAKPSPASLSALAVVSESFLAVEDTQVLVLVHDAHAVKGTAPSFIRVQHQRHGSYLPSCRYREDERFVDNALRALETQLGPVLCYHTAPRLCRALMAAAATSMILGEFGTNTVVVLSLATPLEELKSDLANAFAVRRETATLKSQVPSCDLAPLSALREDVLVHEFPCSLIGVGRAFDRLLSVTAREAAKGISGASSFYTEPLRETRPEASITVFVISHSRTFGDDTPIGLRHGGDRGGGFTGTGASVAEALETALSKVRDRWPTLRFGAAEWIGEGFAAVTVSTLGVHSHPWQWLSISASIARCRFQGDRRCGEALRTLRQVARDAPARTTDNLSDVVATWMEEAHARREQLSVRETAVVQSGGGVEAGRRITATAPFLPCTIFDDYFAEAELTVHKMGDVAFMADLPSSKTPRRGDVGQHEPVAAVSDVAAAAVVHKHAHQCMDYTRTPEWLAGDTNCADPAQQEVNAAGTPPVHRLPSRSELVQAQCCDPYLGPIVAFLQDPLKFSENTEILPKEMTRVLETHQKYRLVDGLLLYGDIMASTTAPEYDSGGRWLICVPTVHRNVVMHTAHCTGGHLGLSKTLARVREEYWWPQLRNSVRRFVRRCHICARTKTPPLRAGAAVRVEDGCRPWDVVTIDLYSYQPVDGYDHILVMCDGFSRGVELVACKGTPTSKEVLDCIYHRIIRGHRTTPRVIRSDHGSIFVSALCEDFYKAYEVTMCAGAPEHHSTAGLAERFNKTLNNLLITHRLSAGDPRWYRYLGHLELCYNSAVHDVFGYSPTFLEYGRDCRLPWALTYFGVDALAKPPQSAQVQEHISYLHNVWDAHRAALAVQALAVKRKRDEKRDTVFDPAIHSQVLLKRLPGHPKWVEPYKGPYRISEKLENGNYRLRDLESRLLVDYAHVDRLEPYPEIDILGDVGPQNDEYYVKRLVRSRVGDTGAKEYLVRWRGHGPKDDLWLGVDALANCQDLIKQFEAKCSPAATDPEARMEERLVGRRVDAATGQVSYLVRWRGHDAADDTWVAEADLFHCFAMVQSYNRTFEPHTNDAVNDPPVVSDLGDAIVAPLLKGPKSRTIRRGSEVAAAAPPPGVEASFGTVEADAAAPADVGDGFIDADHITIESLLDVFMPGKSRKRLDVLAQPAGKCPATQMAWPPELFPISHLTPALQKQAREMAQRKFDDPARVGSLADTTAVEAPETEAGTVQQRAALRVIERAVRQHLRRMWVVPSARLHPQGPSAIARFGVKHFYLIVRDSKWRWVTIGDLGDAAERRRCTRPPEL